MTTKNHKTSKRLIADQPNATTRKPDPNKRRVMHVIARKLTAAVRNGKKVKKPVGRPPLHEGRLKLTCYVLPTTMAALRDQHGATMGRKIDALVNGF